MKTFKHEEIDDIIIEPLDIPIRRGRNPHYLNWLESELHPATFLYDGHEWRVIGEDLDTRTVIVERVT